MNIGDLRTLLAQAARLAAALAQRESIAGMDNVSEQIDNAFLALDDVVAPSLEEATA